MKKQLDFVEVVVCLLYSALANRHIINQVLVLVWVMFNFSLFTGSSLLRVQAIKKKP